VDASSCTFSHSSCSHTQSYSFTNQAAEPINGSTADGRTAVPVGHWKDGLGDIFRYGYFHCATLNSLCCVPIAAGQVISRLNLTWMGRPGTIHTTAGAFRKLMYMAFSFWFTRIFLLLVIAILDPNVDSAEWQDPPPIYYFFVAVDDLLAYMYLAFTVILLKNLRSQVRSKYAIPETDSCPTGCEDTCCSLFCPCLVVSQMMRHTADYDAYGGRCCTETGLPNHAPSIV
jgi:Cys-rich protein (TIGR01571 family)